MSSSQRFGFFAGLCAYFIWGSLPLYIRAMRHVQPQELLAHRVIWSVPTALLPIAVAGNWRDVRTALRWNTAKWLILSEKTISFFNGRQVLNKDLYLIT